MVWGMICWCLEAGGVGVGVDATDWAVSKELKAEWERLMPFTTPSVLFCEYEGGGGYEGEEACTADAMMWSNSGIAADKDGGGCNANRAFSAAPSFSSRSTNTASRESQ